MDDIHLEDPRKFSAKQRKAAIERARKKRNLGQYLVDLIVKTLICAALISINFTLFANAGSYNLFTSSMRPNIEAEYIYIAIGAFSFALMFVVSFFRKLENMVLALCFALFCVACINQFATFEKHSGLLIFFSEFFDSSINALLYEYSFWIIGAGAFLLFWIFLSLLKRQFMFYFMLGLVAVLGWILSEAYFNTSSQYFKVIASTPALRSETAGKYLIFLSFNNLTSTNNLRNMQAGGKDVGIQGSFNNALGFYTNNKFILYPNALVENAQDPFANLIVAYNPSSTDGSASHILNSATRDDYFNFTALQKDRIYLKDSSLYEMLRKDGYNINVFQTRDIDTCHLNNKLAVVSCKEKVNMPIALNGDHFSPIEKTVLLSAQWLVSTGLVPSANAVLKMVEYVYPAVRPLGFEVDSLYALNSFKVFDQILETIDKQNGNQAYFAVIDLPSDTYVYDEFCQLKKMDEWQNEKGAEFFRTSIDNRRRAYAEQVSCLYGQLERFIELLDKAGQLENTTIVIEGLNNPLGLAKIEQDQYRQKQIKNQVALAIRPANATKAKVDYSVCKVNEILDSYFFTHKPCKEFTDFKTTDKNMSQIKKMVEQDKYKDHTLSGAQKSFSEWFKAWTASNQFESKNRYLKQNTMSMSNDLDTELPVKPIGEAKVKEMAVTDKPEQELKSIRTVSEAETKPVSAAADKSTEQPPVKAKPQQPVSKPTVAKQPMPQKAAVETEKTSQKPDNEVIHLDLDIEDITSDEQKPSSDIKIELGQDIIPSTLFDETIPANQEQMTAEEAIAKAKKALEDKKALEAEKAKEKLSDDFQVQKPQQDDNLRNVLQAPVSDLSPEELKQQYRKALGQAEKKLDNSVNIQVNVIDNNQ